jgi:hypothetical protein
MSHLLKQDEMDLAFFSSCHPEHICELDAEHMCGGRGGGKILLDTSNMIFCRRSRGARATLEGLAAQMMYISERPLDRKEEKNAIMRKLEKEKKA